MSAADMPCARVTMWDAPPGSAPTKAAPATRLPALCAVVAFTFAVGLCFGVAAPLYYARAAPRDVFASSREVSPEIEGIFVNHSFGKLADNASVTFVSEAVVEGDVFWSDYVESLMPAGFSRRQADDWSRYVRKGAVAVKLEKGCGRMQNRLVTFADGRRACARYRQNTDQIQGELFSFYLAQLLGLRNLVPSAVGVVDVRLPLWERLSDEIAAAQWHSQRPVVLTQFVPDLDVGSIPPLVRPAEAHHLNRAEVERGFGAALKADDVVELAQWSDLIVFDYLTANLDRVVNNLYNRQWNSDIMEAPAHNLAKSLRDNLLVFLDNESGLLHGYRLLEKYEPYHGLLLDNLCVFRKATAQKIASLRRDGDVGALLNAMFQRRNAAGIRDVLPALPERSAKILDARVRRVHDQIVKCQGVFKTD